MKTARLIMEVEHLEQFEFSTNKYMVTMNLNNARDLLNQLIVHLVPHPYLKIAVEREEAERAKRRQEKQHIPIPSHISFPDHSQE